MEELIKTDLSEAEVISLLTELSSDPDYLELKRIFLTKSFSEILSVDRRELSHSSFLRWLFSMRESHGLEGYPILQFMKLLTYRDRLQNVKRHTFKFSRTDDIMVPIINEDVRFESANVFLEKTAKTATAKGRIDILITGKVWIAKESKPRNFEITIENKVYSEEHDSQTETYFNDRIKGKKGKDICLFVFLTPLSKNELDSLRKPTCYHEYIQINYQDILEYILEPSLQKGVDARTRFIIEEYIHSLGVPALNDDNYKRNRVMATSKHVKNLLTAFWNKNRTLLLAVLDTLSQTSDDPDVKDNLATTINSYYAYERREKDKTHYRVDGKEIKRKSDLVKTIIIRVLNNGITFEEVSKEYSNTLNHLTKLYESNKDSTRVFEEIKNTLKEKMTCPTPEELWPVYKALNMIKNGKQLVYSNQKYQEWWSGLNLSKEVYGSPVRIGEGEYRIYNQWGYDSIDYFIYMVFANLDNWGLSNLRFEVLRNDDVS